MYLFIYFIVKLVSKYIKWLYGLFVSYFNVKYCKIKLCEYFFLKFFFLVVYFIFVRDFEFVMYIYGLNFNKMV